MRHSLATPLPGVTASGSMSSARLDIATAWLTGASCIAVLFSIAASEVLLGAALACLLLARKPLDFPSGLWLPVLAFAGWTLLALAFSDAPLSGLSQIKKLFLFFVLLTVSSGFQNCTQIWRTVQGVILAGIVAALFGLTQFAHDYFTIRNNGLGFYDSYVVHQITGFMGHWMTFGGELMVVLLLLLAMILFANRQRGSFWPWLGVSVLCLALLAAFTRGIWLGTLAGATYLVGAYRRWMVGLIPAAVLILYLLSPSWLQQRDESIFEPQQDSSSMSRLIMLRTGIRMIEAHPIFGLGPERIAPEFEKYKPANVTLPPAWYGHLHNTFLQIAAERGLPCLLILLWFFVESVRGPFRFSTGTSPQELALAHTAAAGTIALMVSGLFEYNFGDSEVLMVYLFAIALPYAWRRAQPLTPSATSISK